MTDVTSTRVLLERFQGGDAEALNELYARYVSRVLAAVRVRLGAELRTKVQSWDIAQEAILASLRNVGTFDYTTEGAFLKWLAQIVENRIRDQIDFQQAGRRDLRREVSFQNQGSDASSAPLNLSVPAALPSPSEAMMLSEDLETLERALDQLPDDTRELLVAVKIEGRTYTELASETNKSPDAVRMQVTRAMEQLAKAFIEIQ